MLPDPTEYKRISSMPDFLNENSQLAYEKLKPFNYAKYQELTKNSKDVLPTMEPFEFDDKSVY